MCQIKQLHGSSFSSKKQRIPATHMQSYMIWYNVLTEYITFDGLAIHE